MKNIKSKLNFLDIHYHVNPDSFIRRYSAIGAGKLYQKIGGGVILKTHLGSSITMAATAYIEGLPVWGSIVLNPIAGKSWKYIIRQGLCAHSHNDTRLLVHLPTFVKSNHKSVLKRSVANSYIEKYAFKKLNILNSKGLKKEVKDLLILAKDYPIVISTGHSNRYEIIELIEFCDKIGLDKILLNQPANPITNLKADDLKQLSKFKFVYFEQTALTYLLDYQSWEDFADVLKNIPRVIYSSDLGQTSQIDIIKWWDNSKKWFMSMNLSKDRIKDITLSNALQLLKI